jgi:hypothetical protein
MSEGGNTMKIVGTSNNQSISLIPERKQIK